MQVSNEYIYCKHEVGLPHILIGLVTIAIYVVFIAFERSRGAPVRFLTEIVDDFRRFVDEIGDFRRDFGQEFFADSSEESEPSPPVLDPLGPRLKREAAQASAGDHALRDCLRVSNCFPGYLPALKYQPRETRSDKEDDKQ